MTFRDNQPDVLPAISGTTTGNFPACKRCQSVEELSKRKRRQLLLRGRHSVTSYSQDTGLNYLNSSRQESYTSETDIELEELCKPSCHHDRSCQEFSLDNSNLPYPVPDIHAIGNNCLDLDQVDGDTTPSQSLSQSQSLDLLSHNDNSSADRDGSNANAAHSEFSETERRRQQLRRDRARELILKNFPDMQAQEALDGSCDEQLCRQIVSSLKTLGDNLNGNRNEQSPFQMLQQMLDMDLHQALLPEWLRQGLLPALGKTVLHGALLYSSL